jgi:putative salt-induced outer membrane protein YdiY
MIPLLHRLRRRITGAILLGSVSLGAFASELQLTNGDKITGTLVSRTSETITFKSPILGEFTVSRDQAKIILDTDSPETHVESLAGLPPSPEPPQTTKKPGTKKDSINAEDESKVAPWKGKLEFGFRQQQGRRDAINFDIRASAKRKLEIDSFSLDARLLYGEQGDRTINDRYDGSFRWRRELSERTFAQTLTSFTRDELKNIDQNWEQNVGAGFRVMKTEDHTLNLGGGLTGQYRESTDVESGFFALVELFQDYQYQINSRLIFLQEAVAQYSPDSQTRFITVANQPTASLPGETNYKLRFNTTLQGKLSQRLSLNLRFEYEFDNAVANEDARIDQRITSSIGYGF